MESCKSLFYSHKLWLLNGVESSLIIHWSCRANVKCSDGCGNIQKEVQEVFFIVKLDWCSCILSWICLWCCTMLIQFNKQCVNLSEWLRDTLWPSPKWHTWREPVAYQVYKTAGCPICHFNNQKGVHTSQSTLLNNPCRITSKEKCRGVWDGAKVSGTGFYRFLGFNPISTLTLMFCNSMLEVPFHFSACDELYFLSNLRMKTVLFTECVWPQLTTNTHSIFTICVNSGILTVLHPTTKNCPFHKKTCKGTLFYIMWYIINLCTGYKQMSSSFIPKPIYSVPTPLFDQWSFPVICDHSQRLGKLI